MHEAVNLVFRLLISSWCLSTHSALRVFVSSAIVIPSSGYSPVVCSFIHPLCYSAVRPPIRLTMQLHGLNKIQLIINVIVKSSINKVIRKRILL